jgi:hypothetical protein
VAPHLILDTGRNPLLPFILLKPYSTHTRFPCPLSGINETMMSQMAYVLSAFIGNTIVSCRELMHTFTGRLMTS